MNTVQSSYRLVESNYDAGLYDDRYNDILDLSEREAANSAGVLNALLGESDSNESREELSQSNPAVLQFLEEISTDLADRWRGALFSLSSANPDAARHFCTSAREVITSVLELRAPDADVLQALPECQMTPNGTPTRRAKIHFFLHRQGLSEEALTDFIEQDISNVVELFRVFNDGTHGSAGKFDMAQLRSIKIRVEDGLAFLRSVIS